MADFRYFAEINGQTVRLSGIQHDGHVSTKAPHFSGLTPDGLRVQATRMIQRRANPSLHQCGPKCLAAKGFLCECSCGGKNHGAGFAAGRVRPTPKTVATPRTRHEFRAVARWWEIEAARGGSSSLSLGYAHNMRWAAELAGIYGPGTWEQLKRRREMVK